MNIAAYLDEVRAKYRSGQATEHSYRPALEALFRSIDPTLEVINEPRRVEVGAPDFVFNRNGIGIGWAEAKDIDKDVRKLKDYSREQKERYRKGLPNLIYTNGVDFEFLRDGEPVNFISIADLIPGLPARPDRFDELARNLKSFAQQTPISITSAARLAAMMAGKAAIIKDVMGNLLKEDKEFRSALGGQFKAFKADLLPNLEPDEFADIYAETITYGMFAARLHDTTLDTFSRAEALELLPRSNPFLRSLFGYIAGPDLDDRIRWIIDDLAMILRASDPSLLFKDFGKFTARNDPFVHFYEDFLKEYNPAKRKSRGVWYTPEPVVDFIVRAVDDVLKTEFGLADGLADTSKVTVDHDTGQTDPKTGKPVTVKKEMHRVQILDPATGTGTFLAKAIQTISSRVKARAPGKWSGYVEQDLIPRLHGFELLMASYAMCHMKLDMMLRETGYQPSAYPPRFSVWLTNALEPGEREVRDLFFTALADEARGASEVKRNKPIMCVIGNPPYSAQSRNKGLWISKLVNDFKIGLKEKKINLDDDYIKFIRLAQEYVWRSGGGVIGFITNNSYLDGVTHRAMRHRLLTVFDEIRVLDLHGSSTKKETSPDGQPDKNIFDIMQGVSVVLLIKRPGATDGLAPVLHADLYGSRAHKNDHLWEHDSKSSNFTKLQPKQPYYFFSPKDFSNSQGYESFFSVTDLFKLSGSGIKTERDHVSIHFDRPSIENVVGHFSRESEEFLRRRYELKEDSRDWTVIGAMKDIKNNLGRDLYTKVIYRPFDFRYTYYTGQTRGFIGTPGRKIGLQLMKPNLGLILSRTVYGSAPWQDAQVTDSIVEFGIMATRVGNTAPIFPLYVHAEGGTDQREVFSFSGRLLNYNAELYGVICQAAGLSPSPVTAEGDAFRTATGDSRPTEVKVFDYIYGVLHNPDYRETYAEFLKIDFPRIPYPRDPESFAAISACGEQLRRLHLMEPAAIGDAPYPYIGDGDDVVASGYPKHASGNVYINPSQHFAGVPTAAWDFHIGGYQPAQKWLKDRRGRTLSYDDIGHYQKIVKILVETDRIMREIELPLD